MTYTENYSLVKPGYGDSADIDVLNRLMTDKVDALLFENRRISADEYDQEESYAVGDYAIFENVLYRCLEDTTGNFDPSKWRMTNLATEVSTKGGADVTKTASGNPIEITDGANAPLVKCVTAIQGNQDLHGYDKPWVGGAGKNKWNEDYTGINANTIKYISLYVGDGTFTMSTNLPPKGNADNLFFLTGQASSGASTTDNGVDSTKSRTITSTNGYVTVAYRLVNDDQSYNPANYKTMVEYGSTATAYEPYSNICPISGYSSVGVNVAGKNLFDKDATPYQSGKYIASTSVVGSEPTYTSSEYYNVYAVKVEPLTTYTYGLIKANSPCAALVDQNGIITSDVIWNDGGNDGTYHTVTTGSNDAYLLLSVAISGTYKCDDILQVEKNSTHTDYEPYAGRTYTISLGDTYYSGQIDAVRGVLVADKAKYVYDGSNDEPWYASSTFIGSMYIPSNDMTFKKLQSPFITNQAEYIERDGSYSFGKCKNDSNASSYSFSVWLINTASVSDFRSYLAQNPLECLFELSTPIEIPLTPTVISSLMGNNTMWTDGESMEIEYITEEFQPIVDLIQESGGDSHTYSTTEQVVGKWIDGSDVYEKSYQFTLASDNSYHVQTLDTIVNINNVWIKEGYGINTDSNAKYSSVIGLYNSNPTETDVAGYLRYDSNNELKFEYRCGSFMHGGTAYLTIRYTKSTPTRSLNLTKSAVEEIPDEIKNAPFEEKPDVNEADDDAPTEEQER